jgi:hypothetical protein
MIYLEGRNHLIASQPATTDEHDVANVGVLLVHFACLIAHGELTVRTHRRPDSRLLLKGLSHGTRPLVCHAKVSHAPRGGLIIPVYNAVPYCHQAEAAD